MGFSKDVKLEVIENLSKQKDCVLAFLSAILHTSAEYNISKDGLKIEIKTQLSELCSVISEDIQMLYNANISCEEDLDNFNKKFRYKIIIENQVAKKLLTDTGVFVLDKDNSMLYNNNISAEILKNEITSNEYIKGAFIGCGSASGIDETKKRSIDYHIEWVFSNEDSANNFLLLLESKNIFGRKVMRKKMFVVYLQKFEQISDVLVILNAKENMLKLNDEFAFRSIKNSVNRISNCENANINKMVESSIMQVNAIELISNSIGIESLGEDLANLCALRLANSEESLQELAKLSGMSKSAVNYRLNKIMKIAKEIEEEIQGE